MVRAVGVVLVCSALTACGSSLSPGAGDAGLDGGVRDSRASDARTSDGRASPDARTDAQMAFDASNTVDVGTPVSCPERELFSSAERLIDMFMTDAGVLVVLPDAIALVGRDGQVLQTLTSPRAITAAAFDGTTLAVADAAILTTYSPDLEPRNHMLLTQSCGAIALMESGVLACSCGASIGTVYDTYDVINGTAIALGTTQYQSGEGMLRVPGIDDFVASDTNLYLYQVTPDGDNVVFVDTSPNQGPFVGNGVFAFSTPQPADLVNWKGQTFTILGDGCTPVNPYIPKDKCFTPDRQLTTLPTIDTQGDRAHYIALANGNPGQLFGIVSAAPTLETHPFLTSPCAPSGCTLQKIDYPSGTVIAERVLDLAPKTALAMRADPQCDMVVLASEVPGVDPNDSSWTGFRIDLVDYRPSVHADGGMPDGAASDAAIRDGGRGDAASTDGHPTDAVTGDASPRPSTGCAANGVLDTGTSPVIDAFPTANGIIVVRAASIALIDRDRTVKTMVTAPAAISAAGFDGQTLVTADSANVRVYSAALSALGSVPLVDPCWESIMAPGGIFVCEPDRQHLLTFSAFDVNQIRALKQSNISGLAGGQHMQGAAGTPYLALLSGGSPETYGLYAIGSDGSVSVMRSTASYTEPTLDTVFQFAGVPPTDLLTSIGVLLRMVGPGCNGPDSGTEAGCLVPDGNLGTLFSGQRFVGLDDDGAGNLFGLVSSDGSSDPFDTAPCKAGCALQKLDVTQRLVTAQQVHTPNATQILFLRQDPTCQMATVGYQAPALLSDPSHYLYNVDLLDYLPGP